VVWSNWNNRFDIAPMPNDRSTLAGSLSLRVLRKASVVDPMCAMIAWPRHGTALVSPLALYVAFSGTPVGSRFLSSLLFRTPSLFSFHVGTVARTPPH
jgi:hypothetical protein